MLENEGSELAGESVEIGSPAQEELTLEELTLADIEDIQLRLMKAHDKVSALCRGTERWTMRVPADVNYDHDLIIGAALRDGDHLCRLLKDRLTRTGDNNGTNPEVDDDN